MYLTVCPLRGPGSIPCCDKVFQGIFPLADHILPTRPWPTWQKMAQSPFNDTIKPVDVEEKGQNSTIDRQWLKKEGEGTIQEPNPILSI